MVADRTADLSEMRLMRINVVFRLCTKIGKAPMAGRALGIDSVFVIIDLHARSMTGLAVLPFCLVQISK